MNLSNTGNNLTVARVVLRSTLLSTLLLAGVGCADTVTYSKDASREGMNLYSQSDYIDAAASFSSATRQNPRDYNSFFYLGASYQAMGSYQQAISAYRSCLDVMPLTLAGKQDQSIKFKAMDALANVVAKSATCSDETAAMETKCSGRAMVDDQWLLAKVYRYSGDADAAVEAYSKAVLIDGSRFEIAKEAGLYEVALKQNDRAVQTLKKAYQVNPNDDQVNQALHSLGVVAAPASNSEGPLAHLF